MTQERDQKRHQTHDSKLEHVSTAWLPMSSDCLSIADFSSRQLGFVDAHKSLHVVAQWCKHDSSRSRARERRSKWKTVKTAIEPIHQPCNFQDDRQFSQALFTKVEQIEVIRAWVRGYYVTCFWCGRCHGCVHGHSPVPIDLHDFWVRNTTWLTNHFGAQETKAVSHSHQRRAYQASKVIHFVTIGQVCEILVSKKHAKHICVVVSCSENRRWQFTFVQNKTAALLAVHRGNAKRRGSKLKQSFHRANISSGTR